MKKSIILFISILSLTANAGNLPKLQNLMKKPFVLRLPGGMNKTTHKAPVKMVRFDQAASIGAIADTAELVLINYNGTDPSTGYGYTYSGGLRNDLRVVYSNFIKVDDSKVDHISEDLLGDATGMAAALADSITNLILPDVYSLGVDYTMKSNKYYVPQKSVYQFYQGGNWVNEAEYDMYYGNDLQVDSGRGWYNVAGNLKLKEAARNYFDSYGNNIGESYIVYYKKYPEDPLGISTRIAKIQRNAKGYISKVSLDFYRDSTKFTYDTTDVKEWYRENYFYDANNNLTAANSKLISNSLHSINNYQDVRNDSFSGISYFTFKPNNVFFSGNGIGKYLLMGGNHFLNYTYWLQDSNTKKMVPSIMYSAVIDSDCFFHEKSYYWDPFNSVYALQNNNKLNLNPDGSFNSVERQTGNSSSSYFEDFISRWVDKKFDADGDILQYTYRDSDYISNFTTRVTINYNKRVYEYASFSGIEDNASAVNHISVYPNPAENSLYINGLKGISQVSVYDALGQLYYSGKINGMGNSSSELDLSSFKSGLYIVRFTSAEGTETLRFVKR